AGIRPELKMASSSAFKGVKQGCPLSAMLYVIAISPLLNRIKHDKNIKGIRVNERLVLKLTSYADDVTVFVKNQHELNVVNQHFKMYELVSGARINLDKTEAVWLGRNDPPPLNTSIKEKIKVIGLFITKENCPEYNWNLKEAEVKNELEQWNISNFKSKIGVINTFVLSKLLFLATIFPPTDKWIQRINKLCVRFIWDTTREVTKRELLFKPKSLGGLGALDVGLKLKITFCRNIAQALDRRAVWLGDGKLWSKKKGKARKSYDAYQLLYSDFTTKYGKLNIDWINFNSKDIYKILSEYIYGGMVQHKRLSPPESEALIQRLHSKNISENMRDTMWLISVGRLAVRAVVRWSCYVTTKECPVSDHGRGSGGKSGPDYPGPE
uniref:Reverse transcriptase domain-containing protein n=1 Tax=Astyanax mexicanus TaxID=7994 RepID=A0A3B1IXG2_ASTMX